MTGCLHLKEGSTCLKQEDEGARQLIKNSTGKCFQEMLLVSKLEWSLRGRLSFSYCIWVSRCLVGGPMFLNHRGQYRGAAFHGGFFFDDMFPADGILLDERKTLCKIQEISLLLLFFGWC